MQLYSPYNETVITNLPAPTTSFKENCNMDDRGKHDVSSVYQGTVVANPASTFSPYEPLRRSSESGNMQSNLNNQDTLAIRSTKKSHTHKSRRWKRTFFEASSIRGVAKLSKYENNRPIWVLWVVFLLSMSLLLGYGSITLVLEFLKYHTSINSRETTQPSPFPSMMLCNHHRFSAQAHKLWSNGEILSPKRFSERLRHMMAHAIRLNRTDWAKMLFFHDTSQTYFETIGRTAARQVSHADSEVITNCILSLKTGIQVGHPDDCGLVIHVIQRPTYFNCFLIRVREELTLQAEAVGLNLQLDKEPNKAEQEDEVGLIMDVFNQAQGLRVSLQEPNTFPRPEIHGYNVEPGKFTEITFEAVKSIMLSLPQEACLVIESSEEGTENHNQKKSPRPITRDGHPFQYTSETCIENELAKLIYRRCGCQSAQYPLSEESAALVRSAQGNNHTNVKNFKSESVPYCGALNIQTEEEMIRTFKRLECLQALQLTNANVSLVHDFPECVRPCENLSYNVHASVAGWRPSQWQNLWISQVGDSLAILENASATSKEKYRALHDIERYIQSTNLSIEVPPADIFSASQFLPKNEIHLFSSASSSSTLSPPNLINDPSQMSQNQSLFLVVKRNSFLTLEKEESLSLTSSALLSRIGGLSSITLGVTFATIFELIEFLYMICCHQPCIKRLSVRSRSTSLSLSHRSQTFTTYTRSGCQVERKPSLSQLCNPLSTEINPNYMHSSPDQVIRSFPSDHESRFLRESESFHFIDEPMLLSNISKDFRQQSQGDVSLKCQADGSIPELSSLQC